MNYDYKSCIKSIVTFEVLHNIIHLARCINDDAIDKIQYFDSKHFFCRDTQYVSIKYVLLQLLSSQFIRSTIVTTFAYYTWGSRVLCEKNNNMYYAVSVDINIIVNHTTTFVLFAFEVEFLRSVMILVSNLASFSNFKFYNKPSITVWHILKWL